MRLKLFLRVLAEADVLPRRGAGRRPPSVFRRVLDRRRRRVRPINARARDFVFDLGLIFDRAFDDLDLEVDMK